MGERDVVLKLSYDEALALLSVLGKMRSNGFDGLNHGIYEAIIGAIDVSIHDILKTYEGRWTKPMVPSYEPK